MSAPELDFDELDKAINTVLSDKEVQKEAASMAASQSAPVKPTVPTEKPAVAPESRPASAPAAPSLPTQRDRVQGRPSAAPAPSVTPRKPIARSSTPAVRRGVIDIMSPPSKRPSRQGASIQPTADIQASSTQVASPSPTTPVESAVPQATKPNLPPEERALRWPPRDNEPKVEQKPTAGQVQQESHQAFETHNKPQATEHANEDSFERFDTLSRSGFEADPTKDTENQPPEAHAPLTITQPETTKEDEQKPVTPGSASPFLSDAKVEKRPLGGYGTAVEGAEKPKTLETKDTSQWSPTSMDMPADPLLEAHYDDEPAQIVEPQPEKPVTAEAVPENAHTGVKLDHLLNDGEEHTQPLVQPESTSPSLGMQSIPQQYKVTEQKSADEPRPIFDTNEYHAPLGAASPVKKSSKGMWITLIIIILLAIAGGLFIYFYGSQLGF